MSMEDPGREKESHAREAEAEDREIGVIAGAATLR